VSQLPLGTAKINLTADTAPLQEGLAKAEAETKASAERMQASIDGAGTGSGAASAGMLVGGAAGAAAAIGLLVTATDSLLRGIAGYQSAFEHFADEYRKTADSLSFKPGGPGGAQEHLENILTNAAKERSKILEEESSKLLSIKGLYETIAAGLSGGSNRAEFAARLRQIDDLVAGAQRYKEQQDDIAAAEARLADAAKTRTEQNREFTRLQEDSVGLYRQTLSAEEQLAERIGDKIDALEKLKSSRPLDAGFQEAADRSIERLFAALSVGLKEMQDRAEELERKKQDAEDKRLQRQQDLLDKAVGRALDRIESSAARLFPADQIAGGIDTIAQKMDEIRSQLSSMPV